MSFNFSSSLAYSVSGTNFGSFMSQMIGQQGAFQNTVIIAAQYPPASTVDQANVFVWSGSTWSEQAALIAAAAGTSTTIQGVALNGNTAIVGYPSASGITIGFGAFVFVRNASGTWSEQAELPTGNAAMGDTFGNSAAIAGNFAAVGASSVAAETDGAVYCYQRTGATWALTQTLAPSDLVHGDAFSSAMCMASNFLFVAAVNQDGLAGAVYVFQNFNGTWKQTQKLATAIASDQFGYSISCDGTTLAIGAPQDSTGNGKVLLYSLLNGLWTLDQTVLGSDSANGDNFGNGVSVSQTLLVVGAPNNSANAGAVYIFQDVAGTWTQQQKALQPAGAGMNFYGETVSAFSGGPSSQFVAGAENSGSGTSAGFFSTSPTAAPAPVLTLTFKGMKVYANG